MKFMCVFFNKISLFSLKKHKLHLSRLFCCNHTCYCVNMVSVTSASRYITSASCYHPRYQSKSSTYIRGLIPRNFAESAEAVPIGTTACILKPSSNFYASSECKNRSYNIHNCIIKTRLCQDCSLFHLKMTFTSCTDEVRVKVTSFQKVTLFLRHNLFHRDLINLRVCLFEDVTGCRDLASFTSNVLLRIELFVFFLHNNMKTTTILSAAYS